METKRLTALLLPLLLIASGTYAQKKRIMIWEERKGCIRSQGNLAAGYLFPQKQVAAYLAGDMDLFVDNRVSVNGQLWTSFATTAPNKPGILANHSVFWGMNYHILPKGRFDPYIGLTPGLGLVRANYFDGEAMRKSAFDAVPLISAQVGVNYYVGWIFHFFAKVQGVSGVFFKDVPRSSRLEELKFTAGLGWNLRLWKPKKKDNAPLPVLIKGRS
ncbi:MAG: hypothetical protein KIS94_07390 [Chitinophagales bacterium]|nr:hypothetical protein [Chitinophagales bacterium]